MRFPCIFKKNLIKYKKLLATEVISDHFLISISIFKVIDGEFGAKKSLWNDKS